MRKALPWIAGCLAITLIALWFLAYYVEKPHAIHGLVDGLGRPLSVSPGWVRFWFGEERLWAGPLWMITDAVVGIGGMGAAWWVLGRSHDPAPTNAVRSS